MAIIYKIDAALNTKGNPTVYPRFGEGVLPSNDDYPEITSLDVSSSGNLISIAKDSGNITMIIRVFLPTNAAQNQVVSNLAISASGISTINYVNVEAGPSNFFTSNSGSLDLEVELSGFSLCLIDTATISFNYRDDSFDANAPDIFVSDTFSYEVLGSNNTFDENNNGVNEATAVVNSCDTQILVDPLNYSNSNPTEISYTNNEELANIGRKQLTLHHAFGESQSEWLPETQEYRFNCGTFSTGKVSISSEWIYTLQQQVEGGCCGCGSSDTVEIVLLEVINVANEEATINTHKPYGQIQFVNPSTCGEDCSQITVGEEVEFTIHPIVFNNPLNTDPDSASITWTVKNDKGEILDTTTFENIVLEVDPLVVDDPGILPSVNRYITAQEENYSFNEQGTYTIEASITNSCCTYHIAPFTVYINPELSFSYSCDKVEFKNCTPTTTFYIDMYKVDKEVAKYTNVNNRTLNFDTEENDFVVTSEEMLENPEVNIQLDEGNPSEFIYNHSVGLSPRQSLSISLPREGIFIFKVTVYESVDTNNNGLTDKVSIIRTYEAVFNKCNIEACITKLLNEIRCMIPEECANYEEEMLRLRTVVASYFELLAAYQQFLDKRTSYTQLENIATDLANIDKYIAYINDYCGDCGLTGLVSISDCGCN